MNMCHSCRLCMEMGRNPISLMQSMAYQISFWFKLICSHQIYNYNLWLLNSKHLNVIPKTACQLGSLNLHRLLMFLYKEKVKCKETFYAHLNQKKFEIKFQKSLSARRTTVHVLIENSDFLKSNHHSNLNVQYDRMICDIL